MRTNCTKYWKWVNPVSKKVCLVVMVKNGCTFRLSNFGENSFEIEHHDYEYTITEDMIPSTKKEFMEMYLRVSSAVLQKAIAV